MTVEVLGNRKQEVWHDCGSTRGAAVRATGDDDDSHPKIALDRPINSV